MMKQLSAIRLGALLLTSAAAFGASVEPVLVTKWQSGDAAFECGQAGCSAAYSYKVDNWDSSGKDGSYSHAGNKITVTNSNGGQTFDWTSVYPVYAVIVKGGPSANIYYYPAGSYGDTGLVAPINPSNGKNYGISHVTFCFGDPDTCYKEETAWAQGPRYVSRGNWAMYVSYEPGKTVNLMAGQTMVAGTASFSAANNGSVTITINLSGGFIFYYDISNPYGDDNLKVQDYASTPASKNPAPGLFAWKMMLPVGSTTASITVPANNFYGVHLDVARPVACQ